MFRKFLSLFKRTPPPTIRTTLQKLKQNDLISLRFRDPSKIGILNKASLSCTRLNPNDVYDRLINGSVKSIQKLPAPMNVYLLEISRGDGRTYTFLEDEIENIVKVVT